jgi:hypothetical protein
MRLKDGEYRLDPKDGIDCSPKSEFKLLSAHVLSDQQEWTPRNTNRPLRINEQMKPAAMTTR